MNSTMKNADIRVILAEDDFLVAKTVKHALEEAGFALVGEASSGDEAIAMTQDLKPDIVVMDIEMPHTDGLTACRHIQKKHPTPVVVLTAYETPELLEKAAEAGVGAYLVKPPKAVELERAILIACARHADLLECRRLYQSLETKTREKNEAEAKQHKLEERLAQAQRLESLALMAGGLAHDFNNLLSAVLGNAEFIKEDLPSNTELRVFLDDLIGAASRAARLSSQMLDYTGKSLFVSHPLRLDSIVTEVTRRFVPPIDWPIAIEVQVADDLPRVRGDAAQLRRVIENILTNAVESMKGNGGKIHVHVWAQHLDKTSLAKTFLDDNLPQGQYVAVSVQDTGCGMDESVQSRIFDPFFSTKFTGRGLGLASVLGIARGHQGALQVSSQLGKGTTITVYLPAYQNQTDSIRIS